MLARHDAFPARPADPAGAARRRPRRSAGRGLDPHARDPAGQPLAGGPRPAARGPCHRGPLPPTRRRGGPRAGGGHHQLQRRGVGAGGAPLRARPRPRGHGGAGRGQLRPARGAADGRRPVAGLAGRSPTPMPWPASAGWRPSPGPIPRASSCSACRAAARRRCDAAIEQFRAPLRASDARFAAHVAIAHGRLQLPGARRPDHRRADLLHARRTGRRHAGRALRRLRPADARGRQRRRADGGLPRSLPRLRVRRAASPPCPTTRPAAPAPAATCSTARDGCSTARPARRVGGRTRTALPVRDLPGARLHDRRRRAGQGAGDRRPAAVPARRRGAGRRRSARRGAGLRDDPRGHPPAELRPRAQRLDRRPGRARARLQRRGGRAAARRGARRAAVRARRRPRPPAGAVGTRPHAATGRGRASARPAPRPGLARSPPRRAMPRA